ncbi:polyphosphate kinase 1 [Aquimarina litoralis]|uniref:polyphosphate kinase 1 n=1 Tax=Aquimarina litoralis TaxID=584605 RepID=UPI001C58490C|nr:polyphosphate kinase 1 [Aquimarina litoralis]MBW1298752.1 polyphosphate kinase 1 [Aquimarina litoralis]
MNENKYPYHDRDVNWLSFNERVLQEAEDPTNPLYERLKFLAIFSSNLDEYFRVRVSRLRQIKKIDKKLRKKLALKPNKQVKEIIKLVKVQQERFGKIFFNQLIPELAKNNIYLTDYPSYNPDQHQFATQYFNSNILPLIHSKLITDLNEDELFLENNKLYYVVTFEESEAFGIVNIPSDTLDRFICLPAENRKHYITFLDDIIKPNLHQIFEHQRIANCYQIKLSRDAELYIEDEFEGILAQKIKNSLSQRDHGQPTRLLFDASMPKTLKTTIRKLLKLGKVDMMPGGKYHNFSDFFSFPDPTNNDALHFPDAHEIKHCIFDQNTNYFRVIASKDQLVHFPYMSFDYVQSFINQAATDQSVTEIKISLYRVAKESELTNSLLKALENGKKVTVFIEAKARFDEKNNLKWGKIFEEKGASVFYSYPNIKVHSKILLIKRKEKNALVSYAYIGTGNFNAKTSKIYCDHGLFTSNPKITKDLIEVFEVLSGKMILPKPKHLLVAPFTARKTFEELIDNEIENAKKGKTEGIKAKLNSLEDKNIIKKLYEASNSGVQIELLVRGFTCLIPGLENISANIKITSIVDRYLEHGRIYHFENGGDSKTFIGSADWMTRNLDKRIEVLVPILDADCKKELETILNIQLMDNVKARIQDAEAKNDYKKKMDDKPSIQSQNSIRIYLNQIHSSENMLSKQYF